MGGDDFIVIVPAYQAEAVAREIIQRFDAAVPHLYDPDDRREGYIRGKDRQGESQKFPIMGVALVIVSNGDRHFTHPGEISSTASELKSVAKSHVRSAFVMDRRHTSAEPPEPEANDTPLIPPDLLASMGFEPPTPGGK